MLLFDETMPKNMFLVDFKKDSPKWPFTWTI